MDLTRKRKFLTEPECRFFLVQIVGAVKYMHSFGVIHRDLKLGNIFLDSDMNVKIGDFGLAAILCSKSDRKKTICGTPNYIAPEVLFGKDKGHSYEVDIWSIGIILYVMLFGKPPFQSKNVNTIYERIKANDYTFPETSEVSQEAKDLISSLLADDPNSRPSLDNIINHPFFNKEFPDALDSSIITQVPDQFNTMDAETAKRNFIDCKVKAQLMDRVCEPQIKREKTLDSIAAEAMKEISKPHEHGILPTSLSPASTKEKYKMVMVQKSSLNHMERGEGAYRETVKDVNHHGVETDQYSMIPPTRTSTEMNNNTQPNSNTNTRNIGHYHSNHKERNARDNMAYQAHRNNVAATTGGRPNSRESCKGVYITKTNYPNTPTPIEIAKECYFAITSLMNTPKAQYTVAYRASLPPPTVVYVTKWVDYSNKYGIGYELSNGMAGVLKPDGSSVQLDTISGAFDIIQYRTSMNQLILRRIPNIDAVNLTPSETKQFYLVNSMYSYMEEHLRSCGDCDSLCVNNGRDAVEYEASEAAPENLIYLLDFIQLGNSYLFQLSNGDCQVNFSDHTKLVFQADGRGIAVIDSESIHYLNLETGLVCCDDWHNKLAEDSSVLSFIREKLHFCKRLLSKVSL